MATRSINAQALIKETVALNCDDPLPLELAPIALPQNDSFCLLGRTISPNPPSVYTIWDILSLSWKFATPFEVNLLPAEHLLFTVFDAESVIKIMDNGPWNIKGDLLVVKPWPPELTNAEFILFTCAFWIQVHGLPLQNMTDVNASKIGKFIGDTILDVHNGDCPRIISHHHLGMCVVLDVSKPLVPGFHLPRPGLPSLWIKFLYERLADYCTIL